MDLRVGLDISEKKKIFYLYRDSSPALRVRSLVTILTELPLFPSISVLLIVS